ncbi:Transcription factor gte2 [Thalictrum thalictroides]|uniref:Transcription factor gte2 n=1 Tax=Thalictrum thalictroides TaxID=46969 RepID=A0A7J6VAZ7_THATH|nr:Transcription factor gte2 [Thalictrum thalictroides]
MASALLASRTEPVWGERKIYGRKNPTPNHPNSKSSNFNPNPNPNSNLIINHQQNQHHHHGRQQIVELESVSPGVSDDSSSAFNLNQKESISNGFVTINLALHTKRELKDLKKRLVAELEEVQKLRNRIESGEFGGYRDQSQQPPTTQQLQPSVKQMPKGNQHWKHKLANKKAFGGKKRVLPLDAARDAKRIALEAPTGDLVSGMMQQCGQILEKLKSHKHCWVFNDPVDAVGMGLHDYHQIIKKPMDLGTVKSKLDQNMYATPMDFAADVRLTFNNAMTYNPKGHDVAIMAKAILLRFERLFGPAYKKFQLEHHRIVAVTSQEMKWGKGPDRNQAAVRATEEMKWGRESVSYEERRPIQNSNRSASMRTPTPEPVRRSDPRPASPVPVSKPFPPSVPAQLQPPALLKPLGERPANGRLPKPKARDANKREMIYEEKQKLRMHLQNIPPEKMEQMLLLMRKRNAPLVQNGDEIELDIEILDTETLWELDRFVCNYRKMMSKLQRQRDFGFNNQNQASPEGNKQSPVSEMTEALPSEKTKKSEPICVEEDIDIGEEIPTNNFPPVEIEKDVGYASRSSSSGSSSSDSSSSSGSDSESSSESDSDADGARSPCHESKSSPKS